MKNIILLLCFLWVGNLLGQIIDVKDSCITDNLGQPKIFQSEYLRIGARLTEDVFYLVTNKKELESYFKRAKSSKRDSLLTKIDLDNNNLLVFYITSAGCIPPDISLEYFSINYVQIRIAENGPCAMLNHATKYISIPKKMILPANLKICRVYPSK